MGRKGGDQRGRGERWGREEEGRDGGKEEKEGGEKGEEGRGG